MKFSINQLSEMTGRDRRTITTRLADAEIPFTAGPKQAHLYDAADALAAIFLSKSPRDQLDEKRCAEIDLNIEIKRKRRIPLEVVSAIWDAAIQSFAATLKAANGRKLDPARINELLDKLRSSQLPLDWRNK